jgi:hypothetical protein
MKPKHHDCISFFVSHIHCSTIPAIMPPELHADIYRHIIDIASHDSQDPTKVRTDRQRILAKLARVSQVRALILPGSTGSKSSRL